MYEIAKKPRQSSEDRISALSDSVLHHILSFLVLKQVIATSVLSTRWRFLWTSVPNLDLGKWTCYNEDEAGFYDIPTSISLSLMLYDSPKIRKFRAHFYWSDVSLRHRHIDSLAVKRHVQELDLSLYNRDYKEYYSRSESLKLYQVHGCLFHCGSLEVLRLRYCKLNLPSPLSLCLLKKLQLHHVWLSDLDTSGCPALECLILRNCHSWGHLNIYAPNQKLTHLKIYDSWAVGELESESALTLFAPNLLSIQFSGHIRRAYNIKNLTSLKSASLDFNDVFEDDTRKVYEYSVQLVELLVSVSHASTLRLGPWWIEISLPPIRATCLVLETTMNKSELLGMASVLRSSQHLESLILLMTKAHLFHDDVDEACHDVVENWGPLERSLSTTHWLKIVKINNFLQVHKSFWQQTRGAQPIRDVDKFLVDGWGKIIMLVKLLLNNCIVLGKLTIGIVKIPHPQRFELLFGLTKMFLSFQRASVNAEVDILESPSSSKCRDIFLLESNLSLN